MVPSSSADIRVTSALISASEMSCLAWILVSRNVVAREGGRAHAAGAAVRKKNEVVRKVRKQYTH